MAVAAVRVGVATVEVLLAMGDGDGRTVNGVVVVIIVVPIVELLPTMEEEPYGTAVDALLGCS